MAARLNAVLRAMNIVGNGIVRNVVRPAIGLLQGIARGTERLMPHVQMALPYILLFKPQIIEAMGFDAWQYYSKITCTINYIEELDAFCFRDPIDGALKWYDDNKYGVNDNIEKAYEERWGSTSMSVMTKEREVLDKELSSKKKSSSKKMPSPVEVAPSPPKKKAPKKKSPATPSPIEYYVPATPSPKKKKGKGEPKPITDLPPTGHIRPTPRYHPSAVRRPEITIPSIDFTMPSPPSFNSPLFRPSPPTVGKGMKKIMMCTCK